MGVMSRPASSVRRIGRVVCLSALLATGVVAGAQAAGPSAAPPSAASDGIVVVAIGDSIPFNASWDCPGCTGFVQGYGDAIEARTGLPVEVLNRSRHDGATTAMIQAQLASGDLDTDLGRADVVIVSTGFNDQPPYADPSQPCAVPAIGSDQATDQQVFDALLATANDCVDQATANTRDRVADVLARVRALAPDAAIGVLTAYNSWTGWPNLDSLDADSRDRITDTVVYALEAWRTALCSEAASIDATCVDLLEPFNGPDGRRPACDLLAADCTHPAQAGNDLIRDVLLASGLYPLPAVSPAPSGL
jgi:lysophospholipase L1-like esterase